MRLVAEWETHRATLLAWPERTDLWEGRLMEIQDTWAKIAALLSEVEQVHILLPSKDTALSAREKMAKHSCCEENIFFHFIPTDDVWIRDYGPLWIDKKSALLFAFDGWGRKYAPYDKDNSSGGKLLHDLNHKIVVKDFVLEGGALDTDGNTLLTSESSILYRQPFYSQEQYEKEFYQCFAVENILWLRAGLPGDDTDGHVDMISRFVGKNKLLTCTCPKSHPAYEILHYNYQCLQAFRNKGQPLEILELPLPQQIYTNGRALPRSYANFYIANGLVLVPVYGESSDETALGKIQGCFPQYRIEAIDASLMILEGGGIHCMTMQWPACFA